MAKIINYENLRIIVEKSLRDNGFTDVQNINGVQVDMDRAWIQQIAYNGQIYNNPQNLQKLRDSIAQAISEALSSYDVSGGITQGNTIVKNQVVNESDGNVYLNADQSSNGAARKNDTVLIKSPDATALWTWATLINSYVSTIPGLTAPQIAALNVAFATLQTAGIDGKISSGSTTVKIGD